MLFFPYQMAVLKICHCKFENMIPPVYYGPVFAVEKLSQLY